MQIILLKDVQSLGKKGEIKSVTSGYFRNFLLPQSLAVLASSAEAQIIRSKIVNEESKKQKKGDLLKKSTDKIASLILSFKAKTSESGTLFSGISKTQIIQKLKDETNLEFKDKNIELEHDLKNVGDHEIIIKLPDQKVKVKIKIIKDEGW